VIKRCCAGDVIEMIIAGSERMELFGKKKIDRGSWWEAPSTFDYGKLR